jgi:hypothetical protein
MAGVRGDVGREEAGGQALHRLAPVVHGSAHHVHVAKHGLQSVQSVDITATACCLFSFGDSSYSACKPMAFILLGQGAYCCAPPLGVHCTLPALPFHTPPHLDIWACSSNGTCQLGLVASVGQPQGPQVQCGAVKDVDLRRGCCDGGERVNHAVDGDLQWHQGKGWGRVEVAYVSSYCIQGALFNMEHGIHPWYWMLCLPCPAPPLTAHTTRQHTPGRGCPPA